MQDYIPKILVVDDEPELRAMLQKYLNDQGWSVHAVDGASQLDALLQHESFDLLVLDLMMPGEDGLSICRRLRSTGATFPILMLTARGDPIDRIIGLEMGADDYLSKPFNPRELVARINAILRRQGKMGTARPPQGQDGITFGEFTLDMAKQELRKSGEAVPLTSSEYLLLSVLAASPNKPLGREALLERARGTDHDLNDRSIDVVVMRLRRRIEADPGKPRFIQTVWSMGYVFVPQPADGAAA
jgi:two-component system phosphate regulon response regulator OmpR